MRDERKEAGPFGEGARGKWNPERPADLERVTAS